DVGENLADVGPPDNAIVMTAIERCIRAMATGNAPGFEPIGILPGPAPEPGVLSVYSRLIDGFAREQVAWCYWKSSRRAAAALAGTTDLDILVATSGLHDARRVLLECGF